MRKSSFTKLLFFRMPIAWIAGVRLHAYTENQAQMSVGLHWFSQNPFKSMFWAVQGMAAELSTGILIMSKVLASQKKISFLVVEQRATFQKKAVGKIIFTCQQGNEVDEIVQEAIATKTAKTIVLNAKGIDEKGDQVAEFWFTWSMKAKDS